ncbi:DNA internalization-related competence protein ComEC/Rec2 [Cycloclasticus sp. 46_120_T64]|nr:DNA internalization-related competence protein ComEC/Rec2 [Cycloclasticus sp. 46_120_T64]
MNNFQKMAGFFCAGILSLQCFTVIPENKVLWLMLILLVGLYKPARYLSLYVLGLLWAAFYAVSLSEHRLSNELEGQEILLVGEVLDLPLQNARVTRFLFQPTSAIAGFPKRVRLNWYGSAETLRSGDTWQLLVKLKRPHGLANPHGFDYEKWLFQQQIGATGYVRNSSDNKRIALASAWSLASWRQSIKDYLERSLAGAPQLALVKALVVGDRSAITQQQWRVFQATGTSHLIAISGLHIGLVAGLLFMLVSYLTIRSERFSRYTIPLALSSSFMVAALYAALAGFSLPTQRALLMLGLVLAGVYWQRHYSAFHIISLALVGVLLYDPLAPMSVSFWLSFAAVAVIILAFVGRMQRPPWFIQLLKIQFWLALGLLPLLVYFFQQISLVAPLANALAVPWASFVIVPLLLLAMLLSLLNDTLATQVLLLADYLLGYQWDVLSYLADVELASVYVSEVPVWVVLMALVGSFLLLLPRGFIAKPVACALFLPLFWPQQSTPLQDGEFRLLLLDVGQGLSAVVHTAKHSLLFDTGASYGDGKDLASSVVMPYLKGEGVKRLDALVISHADNDHAGGAHTVLNGLSVSKLYTSVPDMFSAYPAIACQQGQVWRWDGVVFEFISPSIGSVFEGNNGSCVLKVSSPNGSLLMPADIEREAEQSLLQYSADQLSADVLIAPHHGSKTSSGAAFIDAVKPRYVLFASGYRNKFAFPKAEVVDRYQQRAIEGFNTGRDGAIEVAFLQHKRLEIDSFRRQHSMFWSWDE